LVLSQKARQYQQYLLNAWQGSQARRRVEIHGPKARNFGNCGRVFDQLIEMLSPRRGLFRPILPPKCTCPPQEAPLRDVWSKLAKALPPAGRNLQGELASPDAWVFDSHMCLGYLGHSTGVCAGSAVCVAEQRVTHTQPMFGSLNAVWVVTSDFAAGGRGRLTAICDVGDVPFHQNGC
jgi:hypothetical protein